MVSAEMLDKFKTLYLEKYKVSLTNEETLEMATALVNLMSILVKPEPEVSTDEPTPRRKDETLTVHTA
jgi:hypothetical protein